MAEKYIGIENELTSFIGNKRIDFEEYFPEFMEENDFSVSPKAIRTITGNGFYVDGNELEILTPPVAINRGFATRLTDSLMIGRDRAVASLPKINHTGYSMHWNITVGKASESRFFAGVAVPFHLFGLTPLSVGTNIVTKSEEYPNRHQLYGDSLTDENQINATALILGAYAYAIDLAKKNYILPVTGATPTRALFLPDGRYSEIEVYLYNHKKPHDNAVNNVTIQAQQYLEIFYQWIKPFVNELGTTKEVQNLESFITGERQLEFDKFKYYSYLSDEGGKADKAYRPIPVCDSRYSQILKKSSKERELPLEAMLLGEIVKHKENITKIYWDFLGYTDGDNTMRVKGIEKIYEFARELNPNLPEWAGAADLKANPARINKIIPCQRIEYDPDKDSFIDTRLRKKLHNYVANEFKKDGVGGCVGRLIVYGIIAAMLSFVSVGIYDSVRTNMDTKQVIKAYQQNID